MERYLWLDTQCVDGPIDLAQIGYAQELRFEDDLRAPRLSLITHVQRDQCQQMAVMVATPTAADTFSFETVPAVTLPAGTACVPQDAIGGAGDVRFFDDRAELTTERSALCRGFTARSTYVRATARALTEQELALRFAATFNTRDAGAVAELFADDAVLMEPFSETSDGAPKRHEGRPAILSYFTRAFAASQWSAMQVVAIDRARQGQGVVLSFRYMDSALAAPFSGRSLLLFAGRPIFLMELQAVGPIEPAVGTEQARVTP